MQESANSPLDHARLRDGAGELGVELSAEALAAFDRYGALLRSWNERVNLVSKASLAKIEARHILDSLTAVLALGGAPSGKVIDVGAGAGFPGLPLKIVYPAIDLTLVEFADQGDEFAGACDCRTAFAIACFRPTAYPSDSYSMPSRSRNPRMTPACTARPVLRNWCATCPAVPPGTGTRNPRG